jgi:hypothetical protein
MNDYQKEYMSKLEYDWSEEPTDIWLGCDFDVETLESWDGKTDLEMWRYRDRGTKEPVPLEEVRSVLEGKKVGDHTLEEHSTGALRESKAGRGRPDLLLSGFPRALMAVCKHVDCELGRQRNWEKGLPESSLVSSQFRHLLGYISGVSEDTPEYNLTAAAWNALVLLEEYLRVQEGAMDSSVLDVDKGE